MLRVSHSFHQICSKHLFKFATIDLHDTNSKYEPKYIASSKKGFVILVQRRPNVVNYIRKLTYNKVSGDNLTTTIIYSPNLPKLFRTISCLNCLTITAPKLDWNILDFSLISSLLYTSCIFVPLITSTSHSSKNFRCLVSHYLSTCFGSIYTICVVLSHMMRILYNYLVGDDAQNSRIPYFRFRRAERSCYMLKAKFMMDDWLSTSWILDKSQCLTPRSNEQNIRYLLQKCHAYLSHLSKLESVAFNFSASVVRSAFEYFFYSFFSL